MFKLVFSVRAAAALLLLKEDSAQAAVYRAVNAALGKLETNPRHPGLNTHKYDASACDHKKDLFEAYAQNNTPGAYRIMFCYCAGEDVAPAPGREAGKAKNGRRGAKDDPPPGPRIIYINAIVAHP